MLCSQEERGRDWLPIQVCHPVSSPWTKASVSLSGSSFCSFEMSISDLSIGDQLPGSLDSQQVVETVFSEAVTSPGSLCQLRTQLFADLRTLPSPQLWPAHRGTHMPGQSSS